MNAKQTEPERDAGTRRKRMPRHGIRRARRPLWIGRLRHLNRVLAASRRMVDAAWSAFEEASGHAAESPVRTARKLRHLSTRLGNAASRLEHAVRALRATTEAIQRQPEQIADAPRLLTDATARWVLTMIAIEDTSRQMRSRTNTLKKQRPAAAETPAAAASPSGEKK